MSEAPPDMTGPGWYNPSPDCHDGKHRICDGVAWDLQYDRPTDCECPCHDAGADEIRADF